MPANLALDIGGPVVGEGRFELADQFACLGVHCVPVILKIAANNNDLSIGSYLGALATFAIESH